MVRLSKKTRDRSVSHKRPRKSGIKTGALKDTLVNGFKEHANALDGASAQGAFIPKIN